MGRATVATTSAGWIQSVSPSFLELTGQQVEGMAGTNLVDIVHPHDANAARRLLGDAGAAGFVPATRLRIFCADGSWAESHVQVRSADDGRRVLDIEPAGANQTSAANLFADQSVARPAVSNQIVQPIAGEPSLQPAVTSQTPQAAVTPLKPEHSQRAQPKSAAAGHLDSLRTWLATK